MLFSFILGLTPAPFGEYSLLYFSWLLKQILAGALDYQAIHLRQQEMFWWDAPVLPSALAGHQKVGKKTVRFLRVLLLFVLVSTVLNPSIGSLTTHLCFQPLPTFFPQKTAPQNWTRLRPLGFARRGPQAPAERRC